MRCAVTVENAIFLPRNLIIVAQCCCERCPCNKDLLHPTLFMSNAEGQTAMLACYGASMLRCPFVRVMLCFCLHHMCACMWAAKQAEVPNQISPNDWGAELNMCQDALHETKYMTQWCDNTKIEQSQEKAACTWSLTFQPCHKVRNDMWHVHTQIGSFHFLWPLSCSSAFISYCLH